MRSETNKIAYLLVTYEISWKITVPRRELHKDNNSVGKQHPAAPNLPVTTVECLFGFQSLGISKRMFMIP